MKNSSSISKNPTRFLEMPCYLFKIFFSADALQAGAFSCAGLLLHERYCILQRTSNRIFLKRLKKLKTVPSALKKIIHSNARSFGYKNLSRVSTTILLTFCRMSSFISFFIAAVPLFFS